jgi:hypothetical protein
MNPRHALLPVIMATALFACNNPSPGIKSDPVISDSAIDAKFADTSGKTIASSPTTVDDKPAEVIIKNKTGYSEKFIEGLRKQSGYKKFELLGNRMIIDGKDTAAFPETPMIGEKFKLTGLRDNVAIALIIKRINYTTIEYSIEMVEFGKANHFEKGQASISPVFFLGSESDESSRSGNAYFATEFFDEKENDCRTSIRLGKEDERHALLGKLIKNCNGKIKDITLDNFPTLIEK